MNTVNTKTAPKDTATIHRACVGEITVKGDEWTLTARWAGMSARYAWRPLALLPDALPGILPNLPGKPRFMPGDEDPHTMALVNDLNLAGSAVWDAESLRARMLERWPMMTAQNSDAVKAVA